GKGCHVWDVDGNEYIEYGMGCRAVTLGHAYPSVIEAARKELELGSNFTRPAPIEVTCAEELLGMIEGADMVKFAKNGSDVTTAALKLARAHTGRAKIALCGDHPFFSVDDWFIGTTAINAGIPESIKSLSLTFRYDDIADLRALFDRHPGEIAAVILEAAKYSDPSEGYLQAVKDLCHERGAVFILDEIITGFRWDNGGAQKVYGVVPDLAAFGKTLANGFSVSALVGKRSLMELGGLYHDRERVFLLSTTHGGETHALAAAIATMRTYRQEPVIETLNRQGERLRSGLEQVIARHGVQGHVNILGRPSCLVFATLDAAGNRSQWFRALLMQELIRRGVLGPSLIVSYSHSDEDIDRTIDAFDGALPIYARALADGVDDYLVGHPTQVVYRKFNR
ncbi:MAG: glutamate-1-semialdehyde 2,1-aminomutase, partial [Rhodothermales bacterium]|nr:glutamate-1-semialdehyde 2,1-aminomutase [Rhodothermales bacterium]